MEKKVLELSINHIAFVYKALKDSYIEQHVVHRFTCSKEEFCRHLFGESPIANGLILFINNEPSGFILYTIDYRNFTLNYLPNIYLNDLYVKKNMRRLGGATLLLNELQKIAKEKKCGQIEFLLLKANQEALSFYENFNIVHLGKDLNYIRLKL